MNIAIIGATGNIGRRILAEALSRGHSLRAILRPESREKLNAETSVAIAEGDIFDELELAGVLDEDDVVVSAYGPGDKTQEFVAGVRAQLDAVRRSGAKRFLMVGGAGSLQVKPGLQLMDVPDFPEDYRSIALVHSDALQMVREVEDVNWTNVSPSLSIESGERTTKYRLGTEDLLTDKNGDSRISIEDFAMAILDEVERPSFERKRFTVVY